MNFSPQQPGADTWRLGDLARSLFPEGDYVFRCDGFEAAVSSKNMPQIKVKMLSLVGATAGKNHTYWYNCTREGAFKLFNDLMALGADPTYDAGPPLDAQGNNRWATAFSSVFLGKGFSANLKARGEYIDTYITGYVQLGPNGLPLASGAISAPTAPAAAAAPLAAGVFTTPPPAAAAPPAAATVDVSAATGLFRGA